MIMGSVAPYQGQVNWLQTEIRNVVLLDSSNKIILRLIKDQIKEWKIVLNGLSRQQKKDQVLCVCNWLRFEVHLILNQISCALLLLEKVTFSRRVSNLSNQAFYDRCINKYHNDNHIINLKGLNTYILKKYPDLILFCTDDLKTIPLDACANSLKNCENVWIILKNKTNFHKALILLRVEKIKK